MANVKGNIEISFCDQGYYIRFVDCKKLCGSENELHDKKKLLISQVYVGDKPLKEFLDSILEGKESITFEIEYNCCGESKDNCDTCNPEQFILKNADQIRNILGK